MTKLAGPIRPATVEIRFSVRGREVMVEKPCDSTDQLEIYSGAVLPKKMSVLALQLECMGCPAEGSERLLRRLASETRFNMHELSNYLDLICACVGNFHDPLLVISAITDHIVRFRSDPRSSLDTAMHLLLELSRLDQESEIAAAASLRGN